MDEQDAQFSQQPPAGDELQFATAEPAVVASSAGAAPARACLVCKQPIAGAYFALGDKLLCPSCCERVQAPPPGSPVGRVAIATLMGLGAGLAGALIWFAVRRALHLEIGLVAILVGYMVGKAVRKGSRGRGGLGYQLLAVVLTYCCIAANYVPDVIEGVLAAAAKRQARTAAQANANPAATKAANGQPAPAQRAAAPSLGRASIALVELGAIVFYIALQVPFLGGAENAIGILIIGFALWEAWKFNARRRLPITGPYQLTASVVA
jgi:hypothetical protein